MSQSDGDGATRNPNSLSDYSGRIVDKLDDLNQAVADCTRRISFDSNAKQHLLGVALHARMLELSRSCVGLFRMNDGAGVPLVLRSALEAFVDLANLVDDPGYVKHMEASWHYQRSRILKSALDHGNSNPYLVDLAGNKDLEAAEQGARARVDALKAKKRERLTVTKRFKLADQGDLYESVYALLCQQSHNNVGVLVDRHLVLQTDGSIGVECFRPADDTHVQMYTDTLAGIVANAYGFVTQIVGNGSGALKRINVAVAALRATYSEEE